MLSNSTPISIGPFVLEKQPYDPIADFTHIASIGSAPCVVMANPAAGINSHRRPRERGEEGRRPAVRLRRAGLDRPHLRRDDEPRPRREDDARALPRRRADDDRPDLRRDSGRHRRHHRLRAVLQERPDQAAGGDLGAALAARPRRADRRRVRPRAGSCSTTSSASPARRSCRPTSSPASMPRPTRCWRSRRSSSACSSSASPPPRARRRSSRASCATRSTALQPVVKTVRVTL